jgi:molybdopterin converting factor small subunit
MNCKIYLSGQLKEFSSGQIELDLPGKYVTVGDVLEGLWEQHAGLRDRILNERGEIRAHVNIFCERENVRRKDGLMTRLSPGAEVHIFNSISGG